MGGVHLSDEEIRKATKTYFEDWLYHIDDVMDNVGIDRDFYELTGNTDLDDVWEDSLDEESRSKMYEGISKLYVDMVEFVRNYNV